MTTLTVGATGDYLTFGALLTYLRGIDPLGDDYTIRVQSGTYTTQVDWDIDHGGHTVKIEAITPGAAIIDGQATRSYCLNVTGGAVKAYGIRFEDPTSYGAYIDGAVVGGCEFYGCSFYRGLVGITDWNNDQNLLVEGCYFEDMDDKAVACYSNGASSKIIRGCHAHWTATGPVADFGFEIDAHGFASTGSGVFGCRVTNTDTTKGPSSGVFGADFQAEHTRVINTRATYFRFGWGTDIRLVNCLAKKSAGGSYYGASLTTGVTGTILRCLFLGSGASFVGINVSGTSTIDVKNCGFHGLTGNNAIEIAAGSTVNSTNNGFWNCLGQNGGAGTYNSVGPVTTDPGLISTTYDGVVPPETSTWCATGVADGLPVVQTNPDIGCEMIVPARMQES